MLRFWMEKARIEKKRLDVKALPFIGINSGYQSCNGQKNRLSKPVSFVPNEILACKLVDVTIDFGIDKTVLLQTKRYFSTYFQ